MVAAVPSKTTNTCISKRVVAFMKEIGVVHGDVFVRSDQGLVMKAVLSGVGRVRAAEGGGRYVMEQSLVGCSASNGIVERATQSVEHEVKVLKSAVEGRWGVKIRARHSISPWFLEYAAVLLSPFEVGRDGRTAFERSKGRKART